MCHIAAASFTTRLMDRDSDEAKALLELNSRLLTSFGLLRGVSHSEYIRGRDGRLVFLETSARVGGAHIAELIEAATGMNVWAEWAKLEIAGGKQPYRVPPIASDYAGLLVCLARQESPDLSGSAIPRWFGGSRRRITPGSSSSRRVRNGSISCWRLIRRDSGGISSRRFPPPRHPLISV